MRKIAHNEKDIQKRRATWPEQWTAYQSQGLTVEEIRKTVFSTIDPDKELKGYIGKNKNALMGFENGEFSFSDEGLRASLKAANADLSQFQMQVDDEVKTELTDRYAHDFLKFYFKRRDAYTQTCTITYKGIQMVICRWHIAGSPFGTYVLTPILQIPCRKWMLTDLQFHMLDITTLLQDLALEHDLREEEIKYYQKQMKISSMEQLVMDEKHIDLPFLDDQSLNAALAELADKGCSADEVFATISTPWMQSIKNYMMLMTQKYDDQEYITNIGKNPSDRPFYFSRTAKAALISYDKAPQTIYHSLCREQGLKSTVSVLESKHLSQPQRLLTHIRFDANGYPLEIEEILMTYGDKKGMATMTVFPDARDSRYQFTISGGRIGLHALVGYQCLMPQVCSQMNKYMVRAINLYKKMIKN